jgi:hypothetical protein
MSVDIIVYQFDRNTVLKRSELAVGGMDEAWGGIGWGVDE